MTNRSQDVKREAVIINFKHYRNASGEGSVSLAESLMKADIPENVDLLFAVSTADLSLFHHELRPHVIAQHVDDAGYGAHTGKISIEYLQEHNFNGSLLNHSENRISRNLIEKTVEKANSLGFGITLCVENEHEAELYSKLKPRYIAYEPPELIGGDISVSTSRPEIIEKVVGIADRQGVEVLVGAGVKRHEDYIKSTELGAKGVLVASGIVRSDDPVASLNSLINS